MKKKSATPSKRMEELNDKDITELAVLRGISEEEALFGLLKAQPALFGAMSDWDDIRAITIEVIRELRPFMTPAEICNFVLRIVNLYDTQVISVLRVHSDVRRLAYFVNEMIESLLEMPSYRNALAEENRVNAEDKLVLRGIVLRRITSDGVRMLFANDPSRYFRAETFCAAAFIPSKSKVAARL